MPMTFCATAASVEMTKNTSTSGPPTRSSDTLAPKPTDVKNAIISGVCSVVSRVTSVVPICRATLMTIATSRPPTTGAGRL